MGRFDDQREAQFRRCRNTIGLAAQYRVTWGWNAQAVPDLLGAQFVHGQGRSQDAAAGVGNAEALQQALHAAVFTATAVENDERAVDLFTEQALQEVVPDVDAEGVHAGALQGVKHSVTGLERDFAFSAFTTEQHGNTAELFRGDGREQVGVGCSHFNFPSLGATMAPANNGLFNSFGARPPISPAPWHSRMSPARSNGLTSGARSTPRSM
ncbi:hypothetical protein D3C84_771240 [compost metagenome]